MCLFWLTLRSSKENNLEMSIIFCNKCFAPSFPKVLLTLTSATRVRTQVGNQILQLPPEEKVSRRFSFIVPHDKMKSYEYLEVLNCWYFLHRIDCKLLDFITLYRRGYQLLNFLSYSLQNLNLK